MKRLIRRNREKLDDRNASRYYSKFGFVAPWALAPGGVSDVCGPPWQVPFWMERA